MPEPDLPRMSEACELLVTMMRTLFTRRRPAALGALLLLAGFARGEGQECNGAWEQVDLKLSPAFERHCKDRCWGLQEHWAEARLDIVPSVTAVELRGYGRAHDGSLFCSVSCQLSGTAWVYRSWKYVGVGTGEVEVSATLSVDGCVFLLGSHSAGAALGSIRFESNVSNASCTVELTKSAAQTSAGSGGSLSIGLPGAVGIGLPSPGAVGTGAYCDQDSRYCSGVQCALTAFVRLQGRGFVRSFADGYFFEADMVSFLRGYGSYTILLVERCPQTCR